MYLTIREKIEPPGEQQGADGNGIKGDGQQKGDDFPEGFVEPVEIAPEREQQVAVALPNEKRNQYRIGIAELCLPMTRWYDLIHACYQRNGNPEKRNQDQAETDVIHFARLCRFRRPFSIAGHAVFQLDSLSVCVIKGKK